jgi:geranylgeranyl diphosphate synthase, type I
LCRLPGKPALPGSRVVDFRATLHSLTGSLETAMEGRGEIQERVTELHAQFETALRRFLKDHPLRHTYQNGLAPLFNDLEAFVGRRAKRIRPLLFLLSYHLFDSRVEEREKALFDTAIALELFHSFILIHDDIIDRSDRRRGEATLHRLLEARFSNAKDKAVRSRLGTNASIVFGDVLFATALQTMLDAGFPPERTQQAVGAFLRYVTETGRGEIYDIVFSARDVGRVSESEIIRTYGLKTTKYTFECPLTLGAILAGAPKGTLPVLSQFSRPVGLAFQIQNDLDEFRDERASGKEIVEDLAEGKKTLLIRKAWNRLGRSDRVFLQTCFDAKHLTDAAVKRVRELVLSSGAYVELEEEVDRLFKEAEATLEKSKLSPQQREALMGIIGYLKDATLQGRR